MRNHISLCIKQSGSLLNVFLLLTKLLFRLFPFWTDFHQNVKQFLTKLHEPKVARSKWKTRQMKFQWNEAKRRFIRKHNDSQQLSCLFLERKKNRWSLNKKDMIRNVVENVTCFADHEIRFWSLPLKFVLYKRHPQERLTGQHKITQTSLFSMLMFLLWLSSLLFIVVHSSFPSIHCLVLHPFHCRHYHLSLLIFLSTFILLITISFILFPILSLTRNWHLLLEN